MPVSVSLTSLRDRAFSPPPRSPSRARRGILAGIAAAAVLAAAACAPKRPLASGPTATPPRRDEPAVTLRAVAEVRPTQGHTVQGEVTIEQRKGRAVISVRLAGLTPGKHGFHIHQLGDCRADDATTAGGHFAPKDNPHGAPTDRARHVGDLGNVVADAQGKVSTVIEDKHIVLAGPYSVVGRAVVVHAGADDLKSQPSGAAGARVACGVIGRAAQLKRASGR